jgi:hypothetical protein
VALLSYGTTFLVATLFSVVTNYDDTLRGGHICPQISHPKRQRISIFNADGKI